MSGSSGRRKNTRKGKKGSSRGRRNQSRAAKFRASNETTRQIRLLDIYGNSECIDKEGRLSITRHKQVLAALEQRAQRFRKGKPSQQQLDERLYEEAIDETGTVATEDLTDLESVADESTNNSIAHKLWELDEVGLITEDLLQVHGTAPGRKEEGITRLFYENGNGLNNRIAGNEKLDKEKDLIDEYEADIVALNEHRLNLRHKDNKNGFRQMFSGGEADVRAVAAHNIHENVGRVQEGGTALVAYGPLLEQYDHDGAGKDPTGLGRWTVMTFKGSDGITTRVICGYNPCYNKKQGTGTSYQQQRRYFITKQKDTTCPRTKFRQDLVTQLQAWRDKGDRLIVCLDANQHIYKKCIGQALTDSDGLAMVEVVSQFTGKKLGATYFRGTNPIDGVWATTDIIVTNACVMPAGFGIGDHRLFIIDFLTASLIGTNPPRAVRPMARRLNTRIGGCADRYVDLLEPQLIRHRLVESLGEAHETSTTDSEAQGRLDTIDLAGRQYMIHAEKKCRRIKSGRIPFSPESSLWIQRSQVYESLLRYHAGKIRNRGNLKRRARKCGIHRPMHITPAELLERLKFSREKCDFYRKHGRRARRQHLHNRLQVARDKDDELAAKNILAILQREKDRAFWRRINYVLGKHRGRSVSSVQVEDAEGGITEYTGQEAVQKAIWDEVHRKRFHMAEEAPICQGNLRGQFGYMATSPAAQAVLDGSFEYSADFDQGTRDLLEECARIRATIPASSVNTLITRQVWQQRWAKAKEDTSSSESGLHFSHYKAGARSDLISHYHALKTSIALRRGIALGRWSRGLSVMLEKMFGCKLVSKLRAILLMEADFNFSNKQIFGVRMLDNVRKYNLMPEEIFSERNRMADDGTLAKVLFYDIARQARIPAAISSVDAANCYDRIAHAIASLVFQSFGIPQEAVTSMLEAIQEMKFFLRTAYGDSKDFAGSTVEIKTQGLCQGNGAAPAGWAVISITILNAHKRKGHGGQFVCPISALRSHLAAILFVDDTDLVHINMELDESVYEAHAAMQGSVTNWGGLLIASGGSLKPPKCFYSLISFYWKANGTWAYEAHEENEQFALTVPMADGSSAPIEHVSVHEARETLGVLTCPSGANKAALGAMKTKAQEWVDKAKSGKLHRRNIWFMLEKQFWPRVGYGLSSNTATFADLDSCLKNQYWQIIPLGGIIRTARPPIRQLDHGFYGAGCPHPGVECLVAQCNKLLMHFGCHTSIGLKMQISLEFLLAELGISFQPFQQSYKKFESWVTHSWYKSLWEKVDMFKIRIEINNVPLQFARQRDDWLMMRFLREGYGNDELRRLNRVRVHQQVLFLSDVLCPQGKYLDPRYLKPRPRQERWSKVRFPQERPPRRDFTLWKNALNRLTPGGRLADRLGRDIIQSQKLWEWRYDLDCNELLHVRGRLMDIYHVSSIPRYANTPNRFSKVLTGAPFEERGHWCHIRRVSPLVVAVVSHTAPPLPDTPPSSFLEVLQEWGQEWMWDDLQFIGDDDWMAQAIANHSLVAVTDGSYIKEIYPDLCSAAYIMECTQGRGRIVGSFPEKSSVANAYRGELMGLMAIHLLLLSVNKTNPSLSGSVHIYSDCLGALDKVENLPPYRIPSKCRHSDVLKNIMVNCSDLSFSRLFSHVKAHQDDHDEFHTLERPAQLNCGCDAKAKNSIINMDPTAMPQQRPFPMEPICIFVDAEKMTSDTGPRIRYWAHKQLAATFFDAEQILFTHQFVEVDWPVVYATLHEVPRMFGVWACKQVMDIAGTNFNQSQYIEGHNPKCPSCDTCNETCAHVLFCREAGRVDALHKTITSMEIWLKENGTDPILAHCLVEYAKGRGERTMEAITEGRGHRYHNLGQSQDLIGYRRFMEGMISAECRTIQHQYSVICGSKHSADKWARGLITRLLEITHGQWLYRNIQVHDSTTGTIATKRKEEIQREIERQQEQGDEGLLAEDRYLMEVNLEDMETSSGERQSYWLLAIKAAREAAILRRNQDNQLEMAGTS